MRRELQEDVDEMINDDIQENVDSNSKINSNLNENVDESDLMNEFAGIFNNIHFKEKDSGSEKEKNNNSNNKNKLNSKLRNIVGSKNRFKQYKRISSNSTLPKFQSLNLEDSDNSNAFQPNTEDSDEFAKISLNQYNNPHIYQAHDEQGASILRTNSQPSNEDVLNKVMRDPATRKLIEDSKLIQIIKYFSRKKSILLSK
jgi:hypothetical protein